MLQPEGDFISSWLTMFSTQFGIYFTGMKDIIDNTAEDIPLQTNNVFNQDVKIYICAFCSLMTPLLTISFSYWLCCGPKSKHISVRHSEGFSAVPFVLEGFRWFRQAEYDFTAAKNDLNDEEPAYEWACYKYYQACEKALKATLFAGQLRSVAPATHNLIELAKDTQDKVIIKLTRDLHTTTGNQERMCYPNSVPFPDVPSDIYTEAESTKAQTITEDLLNYVKKEYLTKS